MDYKFKLLHLPFFILLTFCITGCDTDVSPEPLEIIGTPPDLIYYDSATEYTFGASGGDGSYRIRYIKDPKDDDGVSINTTTNPVEMSIETVEGAKASFILRAIPELPNDSSSDDIENKTFTYQLELTDGRNTVTKNFEFSLKINTLTITGESQPIEGQATNFVLTNLVRQRENDQLFDRKTAICKEVNDSTYSKRVNENGETVYPFVFQVRTDSKVAKRTELFYRVKSSYEDSSPERSERNIGYARKDVDYIDVERSFILEPYQSVCVAYVEILDDSIIEGAEDLDIEFTRSTGANVELSTARYSLTIRDNEIEPKYETTNIVRNSGDKVVVPITLPRPVDYPVSLNVSIDPENTTANNDSYILEPQSGVISLEPGQTEASYTLTLLDNSNDETSQGKDRLISIITDLDQILDVEPYTVEINEWASTSNIEKELVDSNSSSEEVIDFTVHDDGVVSVLARDIKDGNIITKLRAFNKDSSYLGFTSDSDLEISFANLDIEPISIQASSQGNQHNIALVLNVNGLFGDVIRGGKDFVVMNYTRNTGERFILNGVNQFGTEGEDVVTGSFLNNGNLYVYGNTNGQDFEGNPSNQTNSGGNDGFIYALTSPGNSFKWAKLIGTSDQDTVISIDAGNRDIVAMLETNNTDTDVSAIRLDVNTGETRESEVQAAIITNRDESAADIEFDRSASSFYMLLDTDADLSLENTLTATLTRDVQLLVYDADNEQANSISLETDQRDIAKTIESMSDNENLLVGGDTFGEFQDNLKKGNNNSDSFVSIIDLENSESIQLTKTIQFGTVEDDSLIEIKSISDTKFFVLWKEFFTKPGEASYRISAFSIDGKKLSRDPT